MRLAAVLALAMCLVIKLSAQAQSVAAVPTEADSAAVLSMVVDDLLRADSASDPIRPYEWKDPERRLLGHPFVFVRIGKMPFGVWAEPSIARLRAWHWRFKGWAVDSMEARSGIPGRSYPVILRLGMYFRLDSARVQEAWDHYTCERDGGRGMRVINVDGHALLRTPSGWRRTFLAEGGTIDALCFSRKDSTGTLRPVE